MSLRQAIDKTRAYLCLECGLCTGSCPVSRYSEAYSPRLVVERALLLEDDESVRDPEIWSCLTCGTCDARCPSTVDFTGFMRILREKAAEIGQTGVCTHAETLSALAELQLLPYTRRASSWLGRGVRTRSRGRVYYFAGCLPQLDVVFEDIGFEGRRIGASAIRLLNRVGIVPAVSEHEVCCGHDMYWTGRTALLADLAGRSVDAIKQTGARQVVFSCPECLYMFKHVYPELVGKLPFEAVHILELVLDRVEELKPRETEIKVTYQDPCRLGRTEGMLAEPRQLLASIPGLELVEMRRTGKDAVCCGSSNWVSCSRVNKRIQVERLNEAISTGAKALVTACPKCNIHLRCALRDEDCSGTIEIRYIYTLVSDSLGGGKRGS